MRVLPATLLVVTLLGNAAGAMAPATVLAAEATAETRQLALLYLDRAHVQTTVEEMIEAGRAGMVAWLQQTGRTEPEAIEIYDQFLLPEFRARTSEVVDRLGNMMATTFTAAELRSVLKGSEDEARQSARAKLSALDAEFVRLAEDWTQRISAEAYIKGMTAMQTSRLK